MTGDDLRPTGRPAADADPHLPAPAVPGVPADADAAAAPPGAASDASAAAEPTSAVEEESVGPSRTAGGAQPTPLPDAETLAAVATPATVRRAPRIGRFITTGALAGAFVAWVLVLIASGTTGEARTAVVLVVTAGGAIFGGLAGAALAAAADRRSTRR